MLYVIAAGKKLDADAMEPFGKQVDEVYRNPFRKAPKELTAEEIKAQVVGKLIGKPG